MSETTEQESRTITSSVDICVPPEKAFKIFTEELDCWWLQGPINFHDGSKTHFMHMESCVGGRIAEVHDPATGDGHEFGKITIWEPGHRVAWKSTIDSVVVDVVFEPKDNAGTTVTVNATIIGDHDQGMS